MPPPGATTATLALAGTFFLCHPELRLATLPVLIKGLTSEGKHAEDSFLILKKRLTLICNIAPPHHNTSSLRVPYGEKVVLRCLEASGIARWVSFRSLGRQVSVHGWPEGEDEQGRIYLEGLTARDKQKRKERKSVKTGIELGKMTGTRKKGGREGEREERKREKRRECGYERRK
ncbi:hypothetical protein E2C01_073545 [Portunus trituberculatus]|uniref:Uncharacterized protein n=1 Tax=Portunus trituberculatus TaxID=210409 RepID=A0A5B7IE83_PORTR|nr:hypothetical protein [Portunus trituberculatus]